MDSSKDLSFSKLCRWFDSEMESGVYTVSQLHEEMEDFKIGICESPKETTNYKYTYVDSTNNAHAASMAVLEK